MSIDIQKINDYKALLRLLISQYYTKSTNLNKLIEGALNNANDLETALFEIQDEFYIFNAAGAQLDLLGKVFNEPRAGRIDVLYRFAIQEKALLNYSGEPETIMQVVQSVYGATFVQYRPAYPAKYYIYSDAINITSTQLNIVNPAGVTGFIETPIVDAQGRYLVDALGRYITAVISLDIVYILDAQNRVLTDAQGRSIITYKM